MRKRAIFIVVLALVVLTGFLLPRTALASNYAYHTVQYGETLTSIAQKYGVSAWAIAQANGLYNLNLIYVGQVLVIPLGTAKPSSSQCVEVHVVRAGDNLTEIAARYGVTVYAIIQANDIKNQNLIYVGQRLQIPCTPPKKPASSKPTTPTYPNWKGQYWDNALLSGTPAFTRNDVNVDFSWGKGGPGKGVGLDNFAVRWTSGQSFAKSGTYRFTVQADDGVRLWVDGALLIDEWHLSSGDTYAADLAITAGKHNLQVDYYEQTGTALIKVRWERLEPELPTTAWLAEYYGNRQLEGSPLVSRLEPGIGYDWGEGPPLAGFRPDDFTVRWQRDWQLPAGQYVLTVRVDDGVRVWVDDTPIINEWHDPQSATFTENLYLAEGTHRFRVDYYDATGKALIFVDLAPFAQVYGWRGEFYNNLNLQGSPAAVRQDATINFDWGNTSPAAGVTADYFSVRWTGEFPFQAGVYRFYARADDGVRVFVDNVPLVDAWHLSSGQTTWADLTLAAGTHAVRVEYFENQGNALAKVWWEKR